MSVSSSSTAALRKICTGCGIEKSLEDFHRDKTEPDGRRLRCKVCIKAYKRSLDDRYRAQNAQRPPVDEATLLRTCSKCGEAKPLSAFSKACEMRDGYRPECKACRVAVSHPEREYGVRAHMLAEAEALLSQGLKRCCQCKEVKPLATFWKHGSNRDGYRYECMACASANHAQFRTDNKAKHVDYPTQPEGDKFCYRCGDVKPLSEFHKDRSSTSGYKSECMACGRPRARQYRLANIDRVREQQREHKRAIYPLHRDRLLAKNQTWRDSNPDNWKLRYAANKPYFVAKSIARMEYISQATPAWADRQAIQAVYAVADRLRSGGQNVQVDHIIPLRGKTVCGLHVHRNLQILSAEDNLKKSNAWDLESA